VGPATACLEGRCSFRLSYGRAGCIDSKSLVASRETISEALTPYRKGRRSMQLNHARMPQPSFHQARTAASSTALPSTLVPFRPNRPLSEGVSKPSQSACSKSSRNLTSSFRFDSISPISSSCPLKPNPSSPPNASDAQQGIAQTVRAAIRGCSRSHSSANSELRRACYTMKFGYALISRSRSTTRTPSIVAVICLNLRGTVGIESARAMAKIVSSKNGE
jgi:hypothetical protein